MIGGVEIPIRTQAGAESMVVAVRAVRQIWPRAVFEDGVTADRYNRFWEIPFGEVEELFVYRDETAADAWDEHGAIPRLKNTMIHLISDDDRITAVIDERDAETGEIIAAITSALSDSILYLEAA